VNDFAKNADIEEYVSFWKNAFSEHVAVTCLVTAPFISNLSFSPPFEINHDGFSALRYLSIGNVTTLPITRSDSQQEAPIDA
jgi:hypothetical protein